MAEPTSGLRFDIYEKVQLSEAIERLEQLDEIELIPQVQLETRNDQAVLKGNLLLTGTYIQDEDTRSSTPFEHRIPVEISLPMDRVRSFEQIGLEIENFDFDLQSPRNLNITGVLSLQGVDTNPVPASEWREEEDEFVVVHQAHAQASSEHSREPANELSEEAKEEQAQSEQIEEIGREKDSEFSETSINSSVLSEESSEESSEEPSSLELSSEDSEPVSNQDAEEEPALKIAFNSQDGNDETNAFRHVSESSSLDTSEPSDDSLETGNMTEQESPASQTEWKSLFLHHLEEEPQFSKVRMCIIQKDETIETIAQRYNINSREILLYNRLDQQELTEGQVIYIPN